MAAPPIDTSTEIRIVDDCDFGSERVSGGGAASTNIDVDAVAEGEAVAEDDFVGKGDCVAEPDVEAVGGGERVGDPE